MKNHLSQLFQKSIALGDVDYSEIQKSTQWLGNPPATKEEIKKAELRLGLNLPSDYQEMLSLCNGFLTSSFDIEPSFLSVKDVDFYRNYTYNCIDIFKETPELIEVASCLERSILIAGAHEEQQFLLIPPMLTGENWKYWKFAHWIPGEEEYTNLEHYFQKIISFIEREISRVR